MPNLVNQKIAELEETQAFLLDYIDAQSNYGNPKWYSKGCVGLILHAMRGSPILYADKPTSIYEYECLERMYLKAPKHLQEKMTPTFEQLRENWFIIKETQDRRLARNRTGSYM